VLAEQGTDRLADADPPDRLGQGRYGRQHGKLAAVPGSGGGTVLVQTISLTSGAAAILSSPA
jgi:hypothetical protein